jgi:hypothetical protein
MPSTKWQNIESIKDAPLPQYILYRYNYRDNNEVWRYDIVRKRLDRNDFSRNVDTIEWMVLEDNLTESGQ